MAYEAVVGVGAAADWGDCCVLAPAVCHWLLEEGVIALIQVLTQLINMTVCYALRWNPLKYKLHPVNTESLEQIAPAPNLCLNHNIHTQMAAHKYTNRQTDIGASRH